MLIVSHRPRRRQWARARKRALGLLVLALLFGLISGLAGFLIGIVLEWLR